MQGEEGTGGQELWPIVGLPLPPHQQALGIETLPLGPSCFPGTWHSEEPSGERALQGEAGSCVPPALQVCSVGLWVCAREAQGPVLRAWWLGGVPIRCSPTCFY